MLITPFELEEGTFKDFEALEMITGAAFGQRRKMLCSALKGLFQGVDMEGLFAQAGLSLQDRAEVLTPEDFQRLASLWRQDKGDVL